MISGAEITRSVRLICGTAILIALLHYAVVISASFILFQMQRLSARAEQQERRFYVVPQTPELRNEKL